MIFNSITKALQKSDYLKGNHPNPKPNRGACSSVSYNKNIQFPSRVQLYGCSFVLFLFHIHFYCYNNLLLYSFTFNMFNLCSAVSSVTYNNISMQ